MLTGVLAAGAFYATIMPSLSEVRRSSRDGIVADDVRNGIAVGTGILLGVGGMISIHVKSPRPFYLMLGTAALLGLAYEGTLRKRGAQENVTAEGGARSLGRYGL